MNTYQQQIMLRMLRGCHAVLTTLLQGDQFQNIVLLLSEHDVDLASIWRVIEPDEFEKEMMSWE